MSSSFVTVAPTSLAQFVAFCEPLGFSWLTSRVDGKPFFGNEKEEIALHGLEERPCADGRTRVSFSSRSHHLETVCPAFAGVLMDECHPDYWTLFEVPLDAAKQTAIVALLIKEGMDEAEAVARTASATMMIDEDFEITPENTVLSMHEDMVCVMVDGAEMVTIDLDVPMPLAA